MFDALPSSTEFQVGGSYMVMAVPPQGSGRHKEMAKWERDTSKMPMAFITVGRSDLRVQSMSESDLTDCAPCEKKRYIHIAVAVFVENGLVISPSEDFEEAIFIAYPNVLAIMRTIRVMNAAEYRRTRNYEFTKDLIKSCGKFLV